MKPLAVRESESSVFSRVRRPPRERRLRITRESEMKDAAGRPFVSFAIDVRFGGGQWQENDIVGCTYLASGQIFVKRGEQYWPAAFLLGKNADPVPGVCVAGPARA